MEDPICGMDVNPDEAARLGLMSNFHGAPFYFCSAECKQAFDADPRAAVTRRPGERAMPAGAAGGTMGAGTMGAGTMGGGGHEGMKHPMPATAPAPAAPQPQMPKHAPEQMPRPAPEQMPQQMQKQMPGQMPGQTPAAGHAEGHAGGHGEASGGAEKAVDPVCRMEVDTAQARADGLVTEHKGATWFFCTPECKREFDADPAVYLPMVR
jgi:YHS domain-containing protein